MTTTPAVPHRFELELSVPGTPNDVWQAIATADGISAWMMRTELDEREGGTVTFHMGPEGSSVGRVTGWEPARRFAYEEDWAGLVGQDAATVTPLVTEFVVEAASGGTCTVRIVTSAFGMGADWENEFFDDMVRGWAPILDNLRLYLAHYPGQRATTLEAGAEHPGEPEELIAALRRAVRAEAVGDAVRVRDVDGVVERIVDHHVLVRSTAPVPGLLAFFAWGGEGKTSLRLVGYLFADDAAAYVEREQQGWQAWLEAVA